MEKHWNLYYIFQMDQAEHPAPEPLLSELGNIRWLIEDTEHLILREGS